MLRLRVLTALALAALLVIAIAYCPPPMTTVILGLILAAGAWEWSAFLAVGTAGRGLYVVVLAALGVLAWRWSAPGAHFRMLMEVALGWWVVALAWIIWLPLRGGRLAAGLAGALALLPTWVALVRIDGSWSHGPLWTLFILALAFAADTGAYFSGRQFGRLHLAPRVSPNKTWEGVIGGMLLASGLSVAAAFRFGMPMAAFLSLSLAGAAFSVVGDLSESLLKRHVNLKDSGRLFPGHGGVLDRIDSVTAATPVMALGLMWLGVGK